MNQKITWILLIMSCLSVNISEGQIKKFFKDATKKVKDIDTKGNLGKLKEGTIDKLGDKLNEARAEMDSTSFSYAISVNDNADFVETDGFKEQSVKWLSNVANRTDADESENARALVDLGELSYAKGYYKKAGKVFDKARAKYEENKLIDDPNYYRVISNIGLLYSTMGRYNMAEEVTIEALDLRKDAYGAEHPSYGASLNNLAVLYKETGRYNDSEESIKNAIEVLGKWPETREMPLAIALNNQAMLYQTMGRYDQAQELLSNAIAISDENQGERSGNHQKFLTNQALLYQQLGDYEQAEKTFKKLINIKKLRFGTNSPDYAHMKSNLAALYMEMEKYDNVEALLNDAKEIYAKKYGEDHRLYARSIRDLANFYRFQGKYDDAMPLLLQAQKIQKEQLGEEHPEYVETVESLAILHWKKDELEQAEKLYHDALSKSLAFINSYFPPMSEAEKTKYWDKLRPRFERFYAFATDVSNHDAKLIGEMFNYHIATKGLLLQATSKIKQQILNSGNKQLINQYIQWLDQKETLARYYSYSKAELTEQEINLDSLEKATNATERSLSAKSSVFNEGYKLKQVTFQDVKGKLKSGEGVIEVVRVRKFDKALTPEIQYVAMTLKPGYELPKLSVLSNGTQLETRYFKYYNNAIHQKISDEYTYDQYWAPIATEAAGTTNLYMSLDGIYNQINPNTLKTPSGSYVLDQYNITFIGNSKELVSASKSRSSTKTAYLVGNPVFGQGDIPPLPGTKTEVDNISKVLSSRGYRVSKLTENGATETALKKISSPKLLHIATHGYFLEDNQLDKGKVFGVNTESAKDNPLLRSGLLFAGAANVLEQEQSASLESSDNGILTAYEAMNLSLNNTELVVLSACETAVGDVKAGEGVYGLQRAFLSAGADALLMSLWKVDDTATQELMSSFYNNWIRYGDKKKAFRQAQLSLKEKYQNPYYWGAFVLVGQ